jgi:hypothetical protein
MFYLIMSKKILFYEIYNNFLFQELADHFPSIHHRMMCLLLTHHDFKIPPTRIKPRTSSFPRVSPNSPLAHQVPSHKLPKPACTWMFQNSPYTIQQSLTPLIRGLKIKFWAENFKVDARIAYLLVVKISIFFDFFWNLCGISKAVFVECEWLIFKLHFGFDIDLYWIWASLTKLHLSFISFTKSTF